MAAATTVTTLGAAGVVLQNAVYGGTVAVNEEQQADGVRFSPESNTIAGTVNTANGPPLDRANCALVIQYLSAAADTNTHDTGFGSRLVAVAWQANDPDETNPGNVTITSAGTVTFAGPSMSASVGHLWCLVRLDGFGGKAESVPARAR